MLRQDVINNFPTEKPRRSRYCPPPEGRSPGAEGTATGADQPACADCRGDGQGREQAGAACRRRRRTRPIAEVEEQWRETSKVGVVFRRGARHPLQTQPQPSCSQVDGPGSAKSASNPLILLGCAGVSGSRRPGAMTDDPAASPTSAD